MNLRTFLNHDTVITLYRDEGVVVQFCPDGDDCPDQKLEVLMRTVKISDDRVALGVIFPESTYFIEECKGVVGPEPTMIVLKDENRPERIELEYWKLRKWEEWK